MDARNSMSGPETIHAREYQPVTPEVQATASRLKKRVQKFRQELSSTVIKSTPRYMPAVAGLKSDEERLAGLFETHGPDLWEVPTASAQSNARKEVDAIPLDFKL
jgi:hypothetical protein